MTANFADLLLELLQTRGYGPDKLASLANVSRDTVRSWIRRGSSPRHFDDVLRLAQVLRLQEQEVNELLAAAKFPALQQLKEEAEKQNDATLRKLLSFWADSQNSPPLSPRETTPPFQAPALDAPFIGRRAEEKEIRKQLLTGDKICVILGMGGIGKSFLAAHMAHQLRREFPDGVLWARIPDPDPPKEISIEDKLLPILGRFAETFERKEVSQYADLENRASIVRAALANKRALVVLDNIQTRQELTFLLPNSKTVSVLITTRSSPAILGQKANIQLTPLLSEEGMALLDSIVGAERVQEEKDGARRIIDLVGGHPLALRIIGSTLAETDYLTLNEYADQLVEAAYAASLLTHLKDWQDASKNIYASFELSYGRLDPPIQEIFTKLALFDGTDFSIDAIAAITELKPVALKQYMGRLRSVSLVESLPAAAPPSMISSADKTNQPILERYRLHSLLRFFALDKFHGDLLVVKERVAHYYAQLARRFRTQGYQLLDYEWENLQGSIRWAWANGHLQLVEEVVKDLTFTNLGMVGFLDARGYWHKGQEWSTDLLKQGTDTQAAHERAWWQFKAGAFAFRLAKQQEANAFFDQALAQLLQVEPDEDTLLCEAYVCESMAQLMMARDTQTALTWVVRGISALQRVGSETTKHEEGYLKIRHATILARSGGLSTARTALEEALKLLPGQPTTAHVSGWLTLGNIYDMQGEAEQAKACWQAGIHAAESIGDNRRLAGLWRNLAIQAEEQGDFEACTQDNQRALELYRRIGDVAGEGHTSSNQAFTYLRQGKTDLALPYIQTAAEIAAMHGLDDLKIFANVNLACWCIEKANFDQARALLEEALTQSEQIDESESLVEILRLQARLALQRGDYDNADRLIEESLKIAANNKIEAGYSWRVKGEILSAINAHAQAEAAFQQSVELLADRPFDSARTQFVWGQHYVAQKEWRKARPLLEKALATFKQLNAQNMVKAVEVLRVQEKC